MLRLVHMHFTSNHMCRLAVALAAGLFVQSAWCATATAQLRSGTRTRQLYDDRQQPERGGASQAGARAASYSVVDDSNAVQLASCASCDANPAEETHWQGDHYIDDFSSPGHGCTTCQSRSACDCGYGDLAPTCSTACAPGCGPLLTLWNRLSIRAEVPLYWRRAAGPPPLVTTSPAGTAAGVAGRLPAGATTSVLLGGDPLIQDASAGFRLTLGTWLGEGQKFGLMFRYFNAGDQDDSYAFDSATNPILARPFFNTSVAGNFEQDAQLIAFPGDSNGNINVQSTSSVSGIDFALRRLLYRDRFTRVDWLYGYKNVAVEEGMMINSLTNVTGNIPGLQGASIAVSDSFATDNDFNGVSYGIMSSRHFARWKIETMFRLGAGNLRRRVNINGSTTTTSAAGAVSSTSEGLLARNTNNQSFTDDTFIVIPEVSVGFAYAVTQGLDFRVGYEFMMLPKVAQASQQINDDLAVNLSDPLVGSLDPALNFDERDYWLQSLGLGLQLRY